MLVLTMNIITGQIATLCNLERKTQGGKLRHLFDGERRILFRVGILLESPAHVVRIVAMQGHAVLFEADRV